MKEVKHFTDSLKDTYGAVTQHIVTEYLGSGYSADMAQCEFASYGKNYKALKKEDVTAFYDADGNALFDVVNTRLQREYEYFVEHEKKSPGICAEEQPVDDGETQEGKNAEVPTADSMDGEQDVPEQKTEPENAGEKRPVADEAVAKLQEELKKAKDRNFANPVIEHLIERCAESESLAADICQQHKTWEKCYDYIYSQARKQAHGKCAAVRDDVVYEWAEDYYHLDDKAAEDKKARKEAERKKKAVDLPDIRQKDSQKVGTYKQKDEKKKPEKKEPAPKQEKPKKKSREMDGQMDLFSMLGM